MWVVARMFDVKVLWYIIISIAVLSAISQYMKAIDPELAEYFSFDFMIFFGAMMGIMVLMHWFGFIEGKDQGFRKGLMENESPFIFLPHGGIE